ncbi:hypothetical protein TraAM80_02607 [Trypanosoma rangeli]|uniref:Uncharacterized protein n=1 Tax=Trypanosoma rangeli TaxID=5698 RepID=A0A3R7KJA3_TRYRA|nr:uncharacterized protein TraAM80_02607 [Trypanosoma rangeli]RNF08674.1 hypothetical protein TraAM80_02607 [Trypanosoma rangeli]|eukprot:RNF08674.1 hypothetical protein TraAM80_02607 [Trypanosoma rangeli]
MPLKFAPKSLDSDDSMRLALLHMLRQENVIILQTFISQRGSAATPRRRPLRSLQHSSCCPTETAAEMPYRVEIVPLQLPQLVHGPPSGAMGAAAQAVEAAGLPLPHSPHFFAERPTQLFLSISLPHFDMPLVFESPHRGKQGPQARRLVWLPPAVMDREVAATWDEMLSTFCAAWGGTVRVTASLLPLPLLSPPPPFSQLPSAEQPLKEVRAPPQGGQPTSLQLDPIVVPCQTFCQRWRERVLPPLSDVDVAGRWGDIRSALTAHEAALRRRFFTATRTSVAAAAAFPSPSVMAVVDSPQLSDAGDAGGCLELVRVVVPPLPRVKSRRTRCPWREESCAGVWNAPQQSLFLRVPQCMTRATELRFPDGKHVRQTLTLRNTAKERLQTLCVLRPLRRRRRQTAGWFSTGKFCVAQSCDLAAVALLPSAAVLSSASHLRSPGRSAAKRRCVEVFQPPTPLQLSLHVHATAVFAPAVWQPLTVAAEENSDTGCTEGPKLAPWRVFPREVELQTFQQLLERRMERRGTVGHAGEDDNADGEPWCHAAFLHDVHTMPLPYREAPALVDDARLHYCYRLALHRERRHLGL